MYTASVIFDYYCRDSQLSYIGGIGFQSTPPLEGDGVLTCLRVTLPMAVATTEADEAVASSVFCPDHGYTIQKAAGQGHFGHFWSLCLI